MPLAILALILALFLLGKKDGGGGGGGGTTLTSLVVAPASLALKAPDGGAVWSAQLNVTARWSDGTQTTVTNQSSYISSDPSIANVSVEGLVTALAQGMCDIAVSYSTEAVTVEVGVGPTLPRPTLELGPPIFAVMPASGPALYTLSYEATPANGTKLWEQRGPSIVQIVDTGPTQARFAFPQPGNFFITLKYTHPTTGHMVMDELHAQVDPPTDIVTPMLNLGVDRTLQLPVNSVAIAYTYTPATRPITAKTWSVLAGPAAVTIADTGAFSARMDFTMAGSYIVRLTATVSNPAGSVNDDINITVLAVNDPPPDQDNLPDPPPGARRISGNHPLGFTVAAGEHAYIDGHVTTPGSVIVRGKLWGREKWGSDLHFTGINNANFQGGPFNPATDIGLWVEGAGELDYRGNTKKAWGYGLQNDPTWKAGDEVVACPMKYSEIGANGFASYTPNTTLRIMPDGRYIPTLNLTRGVKMRGEPGHNAHYRNTSTKQGTGESLNYCEISHFGVDKLGRYPVHHHMRMHASHGTVHKGLVVKHSGQHAFVAHMSDGITFQDCIAYDIQAEPYWYDPAVKHTNNADQPEAVTNDLHYVRCVAAWTKSTGIRHSGFLLARSDHGNLVQECLAVGIGGRENSAGYHWSEGDSIREINGFWEFNDNTSLANNFWGIFTWQNSQDRPHTVASNGIFTAINCGRDGRTGSPLDGDGKVLRWGGIKHGAYATAYEYRNCHIYNLPGATGVDIYATSRLSVNRRPDGYGEAFENFKVIGGENGIILDHHILTTDLPVLIKNFDMQGQSRRKILVSERGGGGGDSGHCNWDFVDNGLNINDPMSNFENHAAGIAVPYTDVKGNRHPVGSIIRIQEGNQARRIHWTGAVTTIAPFYR